NKLLYLRALRALARTRYNVVAAYTTVLREDELPPVGKNVMLEKFVPAEIVNKLADIAVLHGGQGTFYTAAYSGRPVIGIPMQPEQQYNIDILVRSGSAIRLSKRHFRGEDLLAAIDTILEDYETYRANAEALAKRLPLIDGAQRGAERIKAIAMECCDAEEADNISLEA
ncbi:MAG: glycosyltransferase family 1 protein, partial [bacterium]|nr:glycosyltransferase family 1 protein [bacterium]